MKIFKLFVCLSLILSISLINSFAAISVSDGSAFVTKAEFAADLNNLSNRMSSLENSLDAKIDSLVSSYLSRNGIWNGEKQTVLNYWKGTGSNQYFTNTIPKPPNSVTVNSRYVRYAPDVFISTKSGLLFAKFGIIISAGYYDLKSMSGNLFYTIGFSASIAPTGSKWLGDYDGVPENQISYSYPFRNIASTDDTINFVFNMTGFVDKGTSYAIYIGMRSGRDSSVVSAYYTNGYLGFEPSFYVY